MFWKKKTDSSRASREPGGPVGSVLLLERESFTIDSFLEQIAKTRVAGKAASDIKRDKEGVFSFDVGDAFFACLHVEAQYPDDLEGPIASTWLWPREPPIENVKQHRSCLHITMMGSAEDPVRRRLTLTAVTALAAKQSGVMAVYWGDASLVIFPRLFIEMAEEINTPQSPPLYLWVDLRAFPNEDGTTGLFTIGLTKLGHMEIEIPRIKWRSANSANGFAISYAICWKTVQFCWTGKPSGCRPSSKSVSGTARRSSDIRVRSFVSSRSRRAQTRGARQLLRSCTLSIVFRLSATARRQNSSQRWRGPTCNAARPATGIAAARARLQIAGPRPSAR